MNEKTMTVQSILWQAITPLHPGTGQVSASVIDLPVAREGATNFPVLPASSIKGVFRDGDGLRPGDDRSEDERVTRARKLFGYADRAVQRGTETVKESGVGDLSFTDARLLALPVPSYKGTFALVTCPLVLRRLSRDRLALGLSALPELSAQAASGALPGDDLIRQLGGAPAAPASGDLDALILGGTLDYGGRVILQDLDFRAVSTPALEAVASALFDGMPEADRAELTARLCVVPDDVFAFLCEAALEVTAHVRLNADRKVVENGALWYEETIPAEALLSSFVLSRDVQSLETLRTRPYLQVGGKGSVGRGLVRLHWGARA